MGTAEPAAEMALVGEAAGRRGLGRTLALREELTGADEARLHQVAMGRGVTDGAKGASKMEAVRGAGIVGERVEADILGQGIMKPFTRPPGGRNGVSAGRRPSRAPRRGQALGWGSEREASRADRGGELRVIDEGRQKSWIADRRVGKSGVQPGARQIQHAIGEAAAIAGLPVMSLLRLDQDDTAGGAAATAATAEKILLSAFGDADEPIVVAMQVAGVAGEARPDYLDSARAIADELHVVGRRRNRFGRHARHANGCRHYLVRIADSCSCVDPLACEDPQADSAAELTAKQVNAVLMDYVPACPRCRSLMREVRRRDLGARASLAGAVAASKSGCWQLEY